MIFFFFLQCDGAYLLLELWKKREVGMMTECRVMTSAFSASVTQACGLAPKISFPNVVFPRPTFLVPESYSPVKHWAMCWNHIPPSQNMWPTQWMKAVFAKVGYNDFTYWELFIRVLFLSFQMLFVEGECDCSPKSTLCHLLCSINRLHTL